MNVRSTVERAGYFTGSAGVVVLAGVLVSAFTGLTAERDHYRAEAARPRPTVTETTVAPVTGRTSVPAPSEAPSETPSSARAVEARVLAAGAARTPAVGGSMGSEGHPGGGEPSGPSPSAPPQPPAAASCRGRVLSARALDAVCLTVGK